LRPLRHWPLSTRGDRGREPLAARRGARAPCPGRARPHQREFSGSGVTAPRRRAATAENGGSRNLTRPPVPEPLPAPVTDNHCHLDIGDGDDDFTLADALAAAESVNVHRIVQVGCDLPGARWAVRAAEEHPQLVAAVALHPNEAPVLADRGELEAALAEIE